MVELVADRYLYLLVVVLLSLGLFTLLVERHLVKKLVGLVVFQAAIFIFFIEGSVRDDTDVPVIDPEVGSVAAEYVNPLPHLLILTALVVGVAVLGVGLALILVIRRAYGTLDDAELSAGPPPARRTDHLGRAVDEVDRPHPVDATGTGP